MSAAVERGLANLERHAAHVASHNIPFVVAVNHFSRDTDAETQAVVKFCESHGWRVALCDVWGRGGEGGRALGEQVIASLNTPADFKTTYTADMGLREKLEAVARNVYRADGVTLSPLAESQLKWLNEHGMSDLRVCIAKTQYSFSDNPLLGGTPTGFEIHVRELRPSAGAGFVVALAGDIMVMPGLPAAPAAEAIDVDADGRITGLF